MSYANGADALGNATANSPENRLAGDGSGPFKMTPAEIGIFCAVLAIFAAITAVSLYWRVLRRRRETDYHQRCEERKRRAQAVYHNQGHQPGSGGGHDIELACRGASTSTEGLVVVEAGPSGGVKPGTKSSPGGKDDRDADVEAASSNGGGVEKKSIWKYVHWRDQNMLERRESMPTSPRRLRWTRGRMAETEEAPAKNPYV